MCASDIPASFLGGVDRRPQKYKNLVTAINKPDFMAGISFFHVSARFPASILNLSNSIGLVLLSCKSLCFSLMFLFVRMFLNGKSASSLMTSVFVNYLCDSWLCLVRVLKLFKYLQFENKARKVRLCVIAMKQQSRGLGGPLVEPPITRTICNRRIPYIPPMVLCLEIQEMYKMRCLVNVLFKPLAISALRNRRW